MRTWTPTLGPHIGLLISHNESISLADYFTVFDRDAAAATTTTATAAAADTAAASASTAAGSSEAPVALYRPTVNYSYYPCDETISSLHEVCAKYPIWSAQVAS